MNLLKRILCSTNSYSQVFKRCKRYSACDINFCPIEKRPCFDPRRVVFERGSRIHAPFIKSFLNKQYWPREPTITSLWMPLDSPYLQILNEKYATSGDRVLAFETDTRTTERRLIGVAVANKVYPWMAAELEDWAENIPEKPEQNRIYFMAYCLRQPDIFRKYNVDYIYTIEILGTSSEVTGHGVATLLLKELLYDAMILCHPFTQVIAVSSYAAKICERCGLKKEWSMNYSECTDGLGRRMFYPRAPHLEVAVYGKKHDPKEIREPKECLEKLKKGS